MPIYEYVARDRHGKRVRGSIESPDSGQVFRYVDGLGMTPVRVREKKHLPVFDLLFVPWQGVGKIHLAVFTRQMSTLLKAGIPILAAMDVLIEQTEDNNLAKILRSMRYDIESGKKLSQAMEKYPKVFDELYTSSIVAGETGGTLTTVLDRLSDMIEYEMDTSSEIKAAMWYPAIVVVFLAVAFIGLVAFIVPKFLFLFKRFGAELPWPTKVLIKVNEIISQEWIMVIAATLFVVFLARLFVKTDWGRNFWDGRKMKMPIVGRLIHKLYMSRFAHMMATLLETGLPILRALDCVARAIGNVVIEKEVRRIEESVRQGKGFSGPLKASPFFPPMVSTMAAVGESSGNIPEMFLRVAKHYDKDVQIAVKNLTKVIEPILIVCLGGMILFFALGIYLPMWNYYKIFAGG